MISVLGVDPAVSNVGLALASVDPRGNVHVLRTGLIVTKPENKKSRTRKVSDNIRRGLVIRDELRKFLGDVVPDVWAIEELPFLRSSTATASVHFAGGMILSQSAPGSLVIDIRISDVKLATTGKHSASKKEIQDAVEVDTLPGVEKVAPRLREHIADAVGCIWSAVRDPNVRALAAVAAGRGI